MGRQTSHFDQESLKIIRSRIVQNSGEGGWNAWKKAQKYVKKLKFDRWSFYSKHRRKTPSLLDCDNCQYN